jgi:hypothetical protein
MITVIIPIHKFEFLQNAIDNFERQSFVNKQLLFIKNGELLHYNIGKGTELVIDSDNMAEIRNVGLDWMDYNNHSIFAFMDSDDYYSSNYLIEAYNKLISTDCELVGKLDYKFQFNNELYEVIGLNKYQNVIHGPTMFGRLSNIRFNLLYKIGEDIDFIARHSKIELTSSDNFIYNVYENSVQKRSFNKFFEGLKFVITNRQLENVIITKNNQIIWKYGDGFDIEKLFNRPMNLS